MKLQLFQIDPKTRLAVIDKEWISTIKEFREIIKRDKGSKGDGDGRTKLQATKELTFLYHYCDFGSKFINYAERDKLHACLVNADLPPDTKVYEDVVLTRAIDVYKTLQTSPALKMLTELQEGIHTSVRVVKKMREALEAKLETIDLDEFEEVEQGGKTVMVDPVTRITKMLTSLIDIGNTIPKTLKTLEEQEEKVKKEMSDQGGLRGDRVKGVREDGTGTQASHISGNLMKHG